MTCKRCGKNNSNNARHCAYCGSPLLMCNNKNNQKQIESLIVALIIIMVLLLVVVAGVLIYKNNIPKNMGFGSGGGGSLPPPAFSNTENSPQEEASSTTEVIMEDEVSDHQEQQDSNQNEKITQKNNFLNKAKEIQEYSENYLETAESQSQINSESGIVYQKWDALLNEVYQYLKTIMTESEFKQLQEKEYKWVEEKENAIDDAGAEWEGGSGEPMARNLVAIQYTEERCYYLISLIN